MIQLDLFKETNWCGNLVSQLTMDVAGLKFHSQISISQSTYESHSKHGTMEDLENFVKDRLKKAILTEISNHYEKKLNEWI